MHGATEEDKFIIFGFLNLTIKVSSSFLSNNAMCKISITTDLYNKRTKPPWPAFGNSKVPRP
jgi:hypothetical protein